MQSLVIKLVGTDMAKQVNSAIDSWRKINKKWQELGKDKPPTASSTMPTAPGTLVPPMAPSFGWPGLPQGFPQGPPLLGWVIIITWDIHYLEGQAIIAVGGGTATCAT